METLKISQGEFQLSRYPMRKKELLRAWDAADEYLLNYFHELYSKIEAQKKLNILIINDSFGALSISLAAPTLLFGRTLGLLKKEPNKTLHLINYLLIISE